MDSGQDVGGEGRAKTRGKASSRESLCGSACGMLARPVASGCADPDDEHYHEQHEQ
jgi:hypothetical protein